MFVKQQHFIKNEWVTINSEAGFSNAACNLVLAFGGGEEITNPAAYDFLKMEFPNADIVIGSTAGEILDESVYDNTIVVTAIVFEKTHLKSASLNMSDCISSYEAGARLMKMLDGE